MQNKQKKRITGCTRDSFFLFSAPYESKDGLFSGKYNVSRVYIGNAKTNRLPVV